MVSINLKITVFPSLVSAEGIFSQDKIREETNQGRKQIEGGNYCKSPFFGIFTSRYSVIYWDLWQLFFAKQAENLPKPCAEHFSHIVFKLMTTII